MVYYIIDVYYVVTCYDEFVACLDLVLIVVGRFCPNVACGV